MKAKAIVAFIALLAGMGSISGAQITERKSLTLAGAGMAIDAAAREAQRRNATGVIAVVDDGGNLVALERLDGTFAAGANISIGKARTAALFKRPTKVFEDSIKNGRTAMVALPDAFFTPLQGGVPVEVNGQVIGAIGVSGASSAQEDEELALIGAQALQRQPEPAANAAMPPAEITFLKSDRVNEAFKKGAVLLDKGGYMVHASHRDGNGLAEVHTEDTDIVYVLEGSATFVTGGTVVEPKTTAPGEIRGASIRNGETRVLSRGDFIVVPHGVPHWFENVSGPLNYYVVKVRRPQGEGRSE